MENSARSVTSSARRLRGKPRVKLPCGSKPQVIAPGPEEGSVSLVPSAYSTKADRPSWSVSASGSPANSVASVPPGVPFVVALVRQDEALAGRKQCVAVVRERVVNAREETGAPKVYCADRKVCHFHKLGSVLAGRMEINFRHDDFPGVEGARSDLEKGLVERGPLGAVLRATFEDGVARDDRQRAAAGVVTLRRRRDCAAGQTRIGAIDCEVNGAASRTGKSDRKAVGNQTAWLIQD